jgi:hypothetical protein
MSKRQQFLERIKAVEREYLVIKQAVQEALSRNPSLLRSVGLEYADFRQILENLEATYIVRLFAVFEAGVREVWANRYRRRTAPPMEVLLDSLAARRNIPQEHLTNAHAIRQYRNALLHQASDDIVPITIAQARRCLCTFFSFMPHHW